MQKEIQAKFYCENTSRLNDINYFIINGNVTRGEVKVGQYINFISSGYEAILKLRIIGIQLVNYRKNRKTKLDIAVECSSQEELEQLEHIKLSNEIGFITNK
jgi:hypothetical protein